MEPIIIMEKDKENGFLSKEIGTYSVDVEEELIENIYVVEEDDKKIVHLKFTTDRDTEDWEFSAVFDYYNEELFNGIILSFKEVDECYNPTWEVTFQFIEDHEKMQELLSKILQTHKNNLEHVYNQIKDKKEQYI
jgi:hypothetical protein